MTAQSYKVKVLMIKERESVMQGTDLVNEQWFPNYIVVRKPLTDGGREVQNADAGNEWKGMINQMQKGVKRQIDEMKKEQKKVNAKIENEIMIIQKMVSENQAKAEKVAAENQAKAELMMQEIMEMLAIKKKGSSDAE